MQIEYINLCSDILLRWDVDLLNPFNLQHKCGEVLLKGAEVVEHDIADSPFIPPQQCDTDVFLDPLDGNDKEDFLSDIYILSFLFLWMNIATLFGIFVIFLLS